MFDYTQLATLSAILRHGAFDAAAVELGITQSAVSQRLRALEDRVGQPLVQRGTPCTGTALGQRLAVDSQTKCKFCTNTESCMEYEE